MQVKEYKIADLRHPDYNPRFISESDFEQLKKSLQGFGSVEPAVINRATKRKNIIVGGNQRIRAAEALGWKSFPCVEVVLTLQKERELNNRLNRGGHWDFDKLANEFNMDELIDWGWDEEELAGLDFGDMTGGNDKQKDKKEPDIITCPKCGHKFKHD